MFSSQKQLYPKWLSLLLIVPISFILLYCSSGKKATSKTEPVEARRIEILFLGDKGHHRPADMLPFLMKTLSVKGINFTYTENLNDLNSENLKKYDALMIFANHDQISTEQEKAMMEYVQGGKGLIPIHCASFCFRNSDWYVKAVGGQFKSHGRDTFQTEIIVADHPITKGLKAFRSFDETYVHDKVNPDKLVLMERVDATRREPYTWVRNEGKGRVFYTAWGHDENTWSNPGFQELIERGVYWAVGDQVKAAVDKLQIKPLVYVEAPLPNYEKRPQTPKKQEALTPEEAMKHIQVPVDFNVNLFASEPNIQHPIAMNWDEKGRLWVLITKDYPNERKPQGGSDKIMICEDTDKDGKADKFTDFADNLSIPTGFVFYNGGVIVSQAPDMLYLKDTNGDDKADDRKVLFTGWGTSDTHAGPSSLRWGFDNWVWGCVGYAGFEGEVGGEKHNFRQAFFRFKPDGSKLEVLTSTSNNTWGLGFNENGDVFGSTANNEHSVYMAIPNTFMKNYQLRGSSGIDKHKQMDVLTDKIRQVDVFGGFTAACGHNFYTARAFPKQYWNRIAFVNEPTGHVLHNAIIEQKGSDFEERDGWNLIASAEEWFAPVFAEVGPDGAVWMLDWYSFIIQHNPTPQGFKTGAGNAYESPVRDFTHGRIYRIGYKNAPSYNPISLSKENPTELVKALSSSNLFWRITAQRLLVERGNKDVVPQLIALVNDKSVDEVGVNGAAMQALWTLHGLNQVDGSNQEALTAVKDALNHPSSGVRRAAIKVLPKTKETGELLLSLNLLTDKDPLLVLDATLALSQCPFSPQIQEALIAAIQNPQYLSDKWIPEAYTILAASNKSQFLKAYLSKAKPNLKDKASVKKAVATKNENPSTHDHHAGHHMATAEAAVPEAKTNTPDLAITHLSYSPAQPKAGDQVTFTATIQNKGTTATKAAKQIGLLFNVNGERFWNDKFENSIEPGESVTLSQTNGRGGKTWKAVQGSFKVKVTVNEWNQNEDGDPSNNLLEDSIKVKPITSITPFVVTNVTRTYTMEAPYDSVLTLLASLKNINNEEAEPILSGIFQGWSAKQSVAKEKDKKLVKSMIATADETNGLLLNQLLEAWTTPAESDDKDVLKIFISSVPEMIKFTKKEFTVEAGKKVEIVFENPDQMQHNMVIGAIGSMEKIGLAADKMITQADGKDKNYVPEIPEVLFFSPLVDPGKKVSLKFTAPSQNGSYPYVCTFPGHWRIMNGVMKVK
jgi:uncharacterized protein